MRPGSLESRWRTVAAVTVALTVGSLVPSPFERHPEWRWVGPDKALHLVGHAAYATALADAFGAGRHSDRTAAVLAVVVSTAHSLVVGRLQERVPGRGFELADVLAGLLGATLAVARWRVRDR